jgi:SAM-dependent methyltransferase
MKDVMLATLLVLFAALPGCQKQRQATPPTQPTSALSSAARPAPDATLPPIECPLAKRGMNHAHLRPFEEVEKYIAFLERPDRAAWQRPDAVMAALGLKGDEHVVDVGAGAGYFAFRFAKALPRGSVVASDVEPEMVRHMHHKAMTEGIRNLSAVLGKPDDPEIPSEANLVFVCDVLHHVADRGAWLAKLAGEMRKGARLVMVEFKEGRLPEGPPENAKISSTELIRLVTAAGLTLEGEKPDLLPYQSFLTFRKP